jgi:predicted SAM-dependent methyltransferase
MSGKKEVHILKNKCSIICYTFFKTLKNDYGLNFNFLKGIFDFVIFYKDFSHYRSINNNPNFLIDSKFIYPCLLDKTSTTPIEPVYFFQDAWAAQKIFTNRPIHHVDIGSSIKTIGIISQCVPTTFVDIRPIDISLPNLFLKEGSILNLPFKNNSLESLSSLCVIEHIGLGRYGDPVDPWGSEKSVKELMRVVKPGGHLYISVPVDEVNKVFYNAHRAFTREYIINLFSQMILVEESYIYGKKTYSDYDRNRGFGTGLYHFIKT